MWTSSIRPEDIRLPDESTHLDAVMGRVYQRVLTHKGIEFEGLFYNSPDLTNLRIFEGANLDVEIRVDESNLGSIFVLWPKTSATFKVPALNAEYADGISLWQHSIFKKWQREKDPSNQNPYGWLKAQEEIQRRIEEDLSLKFRRSRMRVARIKEASEKNSASRKNSKNVAARSLPQPEASTQAPFPSSEPIEGTKLAHSPVPAIRPARAARPIYKAVMIKERNDY
jgi:putative transposase